MLCCGAVSGDKSLVFIHQVTSTPHGGRVTFEPRARRAQFDKLLGFKVNLWVE